MSMPAYKDSKTGTWFVKFYCKDWTGENKQIKKRGFATKREALDYERNYKIRQENNLDMTFGEFWKLYTEDVKNRVKLNTWLTKEHIVETKILPYFKNLKMADKLDEVNASYEDGVQDEVMEDVAVNEVIEDKVTSEESIENDNKILNIQKYLAG